MPVTVIGAYIVGILLLFMFARFLTVPLKMVFRLIYNGLVGGVVFLLPITVWTALLVGFFGLAGVAALVLYQLFFIGKIM